MHGGLPIFEIRFLATLKSYIIQNTFILFTKTHILLWTIIRLGLLETLFAGTFPSVLTYLIFDGKLTVPKKSIILLQTFKRYYWSMNCAVVDNLWSNKWSIILSTLGF